MSTPATLLADAPGRSKPWVRHLATASRLLLGLVFLVFGLNGFLNFIPPPSTPMPAAATDFFGGLFKSGYMIPLISGTQLLSGALLLANRFVPLALVLLAPVVVNIVLFHVCLSRDGLAIALVVLALELHLAWTHRAAYRPLLAARPAPHA